MNIEKFKSLLPDMAKKKLSPGKLMTQYAAFLRQFPKCAEVLDKVGIPNGLMPTPALARILKILDSEKDPAPPKKEKPAKIPGLTLVHGSRPAKPAKVIDAEFIEEEEKSPPKYTVTLHRNAVETEELKGADMYGDAERIAHNKLMREASDAYCTIDGWGGVTKVTYVQAVKAILGQRPGGKVRCTGPGKGQGKLTEPARVNNFVAKFSHG